jgi:pyridoxal phosphate enzyme (YggS family)
VIGERYRQVLDRVRAACERCGREPDDVTVVAVSKTQPVEVIEEIVEAGCLDLGENRVAEWRDKSARLPRRIRWHFIGHLQRNKVKYLVDEIALLHSLDTVGLVEALEKRADSPHDVLIEVNIGTEAQKSGVAPSDVLDLVRRCAESTVVRPIGLMCIPPHAEDPEASRPYYRAMAELHAEARALLTSIDDVLAEDFTHLSMGMTRDLEVGIEEGATIVRVGTAIFGERRVTAR